MRAVIQRVKSASVVVDGQVKGRIGRGLLILAAVHRDDDEAQLRWIADKILKLRVFNDENGKMNRSVTDENGGLLVVSQFTLYGDTRKGTRPSYIESASPEKAEKMYNDLVTCLRENSDLQVQEGVFGAMMEVSLVNDGPVTIILDR
ncbi:MAG: D-aminoacyl-tRNA deacylase [Cyclonatronaceae bacterium]